MPISVFHHERSRGASRRPADEGSVNLPSEGRHLAVSVSATAEQAERGIQDL